MGYKHGQARRGKETPEYWAWRHIKNRCQNSNDKDYKDYGGRGIRVCQRWQDFRNFFADMGKRPGPEYSIDRMDNNGGYKSNNCHWATPKEQNNNRRPRSHGPCKQQFFYGHGPNGEMIIENSQCEVAKEFCLDQSDISKCLHGIMEQHKGWRFQWI